MSGVEGADRQELLSHRSTVRRPTGRAGRRGRRAPATAARGRVAGTAPEQLRAARRRACGEVVRQSSSTTPAARRAVSSDGPPSQSSRSQAALVQRRRRGSAGSVVETSTPGTSTPSGTANSTGPCRKRVVGDLAAAAHHDERGRRAAPVGCAPGGGRAVGAAPGRSPPRAPSPLRRRRRRATVRSARKTALSARAAQPADVPSTAIAPSTRRHEPGPEVAGRARRTGRRGRRGGGPDGSGSSCRMPRSDHVRHQGVRRDLAEAAGLEVLDRLLQLLAGVHDERPVLRDRLADRLRRRGRGPRGRRTGCPACRRRRR